MRQTDTQQVSMLNAETDDRRVNTSITTMTQLLRGSVDSQRNRSTLHGPSLSCPEGQPGRTVRPSLVGPQSLPFGLPWPLSLIYATFGRLHTALMPRCHLFNFAC